ncbi:hypothetical protein [Bacteroides caecimuris]|uniref:hypothetical protein n=1 Tax=Bacteroides caecimuris TaxID=1796613 RepID=UPI0025B7977D|nr:hypothetical protein [Bacteroides caecimuris]
MKTVHLSDVLINNPKTVEDIVGVPNGFKTSEMVMDNMFVMFHRKNDNHPLMVKSNKWASYQNRGEIAEGVVVVEGGKMLVVAPTESDSEGLLWSSAAVSGGGKTTPDRLVAFYDWSGNANTAAQITHAECSSAAYAPGFCAQYSRVNANGKGLTAGRWWLPSEGELMMIYANMRKINYCLSLIEGTTQLSETWYWSSTEYNESFAWHLNLYDGIANGHAKTAVKGRVRPVSAFLI